LFTPKVTELSKAATKPPNETDPFSQGMSSAASDSSAATQREVVPRKRGMTRNVRHVLIFFIGICVVVGVVI
jgi:hypothetical protein